MTISQAKRRKGLDLSKQVAQSSIFVIDDDEVVVEMINFHLGDSGFQQVHVFTNPEEAFETLRYVRPDIILTDLYMPRVGGSFLTRLVRTFEHLHDVPVVIITSESDVETHKRLESVGADMVITKPFDADQMVQSIRTILQETAFVNHLMKEQQREKETEHIESIRHIHQLEEKLRTLYRQ